MKFKGHRLYWRRWNKYGGFKWVNYDRYSGTNPPKWCGFHLHLGWGALVYEQPLR